MALPNGGARALDTVAFGVVHHAIAITITITTTITITITITVAIKVHHLFVVFRPHHRRRCRHRRPSKCANAASAAFV
jgi:hypothetical protein